jgi:hypothetical protein
MRYIAGLLSLCFLSFGTLEVAAAPAEVLGNSVIVSWSESREITNKGDTSQRHRRRASDLAVYISSAGRPFSRFSKTGLRKRGKTETSEQAPNEAATNGRSRVVHFEGSTLVVDTELDSGVRRVTINFEGGSCSAKVSYARLGGAKPLVGSHATINSVDVSTASCAIRPGNVFGQ